MTSPLFSRAVGPTRDPSRAGAVWVAGTGAFLLLAASAVFVASNWDEIPPTAKLAAIGLLTGACLVAGRSLRDTLPGTSGALYHLGAFLIPVDVAALAVHLGAAPAELALAEGVVCGISLWFLDRAVPSTLLRCGAAVSVVVASAGLGGISGVPSGLLLAGAAIVALVAGAHRAAIGWALAAGIAPLAVGAAAIGGGRVAWLTTFALGGETAGWAAVGTGLLSAGVLCRLAGVRRAPELAVLGLTTGAIGIGTTWWTAAPEPGTNLVLLATGLFVIEVGATLLRRDDLWRPVLAPVAVAAEVAATFAAFFGLALTLAASIGDAADHDALPSDPALAGALAITVATWLLADLRRRHDDAQPTLIALLTGSGFAPTAAAAAACGIGAVAVVGDPLVTAIAMAATAGLLVCTGRPFAQATALVCVTLAPLAARSEPALIAALAAGGALLLAWATALRVEADATHPPRHPERTWLLASSVGLPVLVAAAVEGTESLLPWLLGAIAVLWCTAPFLDIGDRDESTRGLGLLPRYSSLLVLAPAGLGHAELALLAGVLLALAVAESTRRRDPDLAFSTVVSLPVLVLATCTGLDLAPATSGLVLAAFAPVIAVAAIAAGPLGGVGRARWQLVAIALGGTCAALGGLLAATDPASTATYLLMAGGTLLGIGVWVRHSQLPWGGALLLVLGAETHLSLAEVETSEPYLAPVCLLLIAAGIAARRAALRSGLDPVSSWLAYLPALALLGGAALAERIDGGGPGHAAVAGTVAVVAVVVGGWRRLAAPIFGGTALLVGVTGYESLAVTADLPTWVWLAVGGTILLGAGIVLERTATSPIEGGRRLVQVIGERFG